MIPAQLVLDTDVVIHLLRKHPQTVARFLALLEDNTVFLLSPIVVAEIYAGALVREYPQIEALFDLCQRIQIDSDTARQAGLYACQYRKAFQGISLEDFLLAATAQAHRCPLWTNNRKHYPMNDIELLPS